MYPATSACPTISCPLALDLLTYREEAIYYPQKTLRLSDSGPCLRSDLCLGYLYDLHLQLPMISLLALCQRFPSTRGSCVNVVAEYYSGPLSGY